MSESSPGVLARVKRRLPGQLGALTVIILIWIFLAGTYNTIWSEQEGTIKTDDCRVKVVTTKDSARTWFKTFTCEYSRDDQGKITSGTCRHVETDNTGRCETVLTYYR